MYLPNCSFTTQIAVVFLIDLLNIYSLHSDTSCIACLGTGPCWGFQLTAYVSQSGLHGEVIFQQHPGDKSTVMVQTSLQAIDEQSQWSWMVRELPVFYSQIQDRCGDDKLGSM